MLWTDGGLALPYYMSEQTGQPQSRLHPLCISVSPHGRLEESCFSTSQGRSLGNYLLNVQIKEKKPGNGKQWWC